MRKRFAIRGRWAALAISFTFALSFLGAPGARAASPGCSLSSHCYSILTAYGTTFYGAYGTWNRGAMSTASSQSDPRFIDSEMWFYPSSSSNAWVETGLTRGWLTPAGATGYFAFGAYNTTGNSYHEYSFGSVSQSSSVTDEFQISRASSTNTFRIYFDGSYKTTPSVGFWSGSGIDMGAEVATSTGTSGTFTMYGRGLNSAGSRVYFGSETTYKDDPPLYGSRPSDSAWTWRIR